MLIRNNYTTMHTKIPAVYGILHRYDSYHWLSFVWRE